MEIIGCRAPDDDAVMNASRRMRDGVNIVKEYAFSPATMGTSPLKVEASAMGVELCTVCEDRSNQFEIGVRYGNAFCDESGGFQFGRVVERFLCAVCTEHESGDGAG